MKQFSTKQKWLLCTALIMALGSQSYYQVASNHMNVTELASYGDTPEGLAEAEQILAASAEEQKQYDATKKAAELTSATERSVLVSQQENRKKSDDVKLYEFYKTYEAKKMAEARASKVEEEKKLKEAQAKAAAKLAEKRAAKIKADNKDKHNEVDYYKSYKQFEQTRMDEARASKDAEQRVKLEKDAKYYREKADEIAAVLVGPHRTAEQLKAPIKVETQVQAKVEKKAEAKSEVKVEDKAPDKAKTEAKVSKTEACEGGCGKDSTEQVLVAALKIIEEQKAQEKKKSEDKAPVNETAKERRERLAEVKKAKKEEAEEAKREKAEAKKEKEQLAKDERNEKFTERAEKIAEQCAGDIECSSSRLSSLLNEFSGDKSKVDIHIVNKAFNEHFAKDFRAAARNPENSQAVAEALYQLNADVPAAYRIIKEKTIDILRNESMLRASEINRNFKLADSLTKAKRPVEANQALTTGIYEVEQFRHDSNVFGNSIVSGLRSADDAKTLDYVKRGYIPDVQKLFTDIQNVNGIDFGKLGSGSSSTLSTSNRPSTSSRVNRGANTATTSVNGKTTVQRGGVSIGTPSGSRSNSRGAY